ncbi:MAG: hypothetical protein RLZZ303_3194 [Candidatus Hydrogenedentota bacterium]|jgi:cell division protein FtsQ
MSKAEPLYHPMRPRVRSRRRARRRLLANLVKYTGTLLLFVGAGYAFLAYFSESPRFALQRVHISGNQALTHDDIVQAANLTTALNTLMLDPTVIEQQLELMPYVDSCTVRREFPGNLFIDVRERTPFALLQFDNHTFEMDREGRLLRELDPLAPIQLPLMSSAEIPSLPATGEQLDLPGLNSAMELVEAYYATSLDERVKLSEIAVKDAGTLLMFVDELPFEIRWGRADHFAQAQRLDTLLLTKGLELPCTEYLDLRFDADLVCK